MAEPFRGLSGAPGDTACAFWDSEPAPGRARSGAGLRWLLSRCSNRFLTFRLTKFWEIAVMVRLMATSRRFTRCPNCSFEYLKFGEATLKEDATVVSLGPVPSATGTATFFRMEPSPKCLPTGSPVLVQHLPLRRRRSRINSRAPAGRRGSKFSAPRSPAIRAEVPPGVVQLSAIRTASLFRHPLPVPR
jgi:hypothetical protein